MTEQRPRVVRARVRALTNTARTVETSAAISLPTCPPADAIDGPMRVFRVAKNNPVDASDFLTHEEKGLIPDGDPCGRKALSSYPDRSGADRLRNRVPYFRKHYICDGTVPKGAGKFMHTPSGQEHTHWSWWPTPEIDRHSYFQVVP